MSASGNKAGKSVHQFSRRIPRTDDVAIIFFFLVAHAFLVSPFLLSLIVRIYDATVCYNTNLMSRIQMSDCTYLILACSAVLFKQLFLFFMDGQ